MSVMAERMLACIREGGAASCVELVRAAGQEATGDCCLSLPGHPNTLLWVNVSERFLEAFNEIKDEVEPYPASVLVYAWDGEVLNLPQVRRLGKQDFKTPHWLPVTFGLREQHISSLARKEKSEKRSN